MKSESHILVSLQNNIQKYQKVKRHYNEYIKFKKRQQLEIQKGQENEEELKCGFMRDQSDLRFTYDFIKGLISDSKDIDIDIYSTQGNQKDRGFDIPAMEKDLADYDEFKDKFIALLSQLEVEIFEKQSSQMMNEIRESTLHTQFQKMRIDITFLSVYDKPTYKKIQAFVWIFNAYELMETGQIDPDSPFYVQVDSKEGQSQRNYMSIKQWKDFIKYHEKFNSILPELKNHSIVQQLHWQI